MPTSHISSSLFASFSQHKALQAPQPTPSPTLPTLEEDKPAGTPSLLPGKQGRTGHSPPGQARHGHHPHTTLLQGKQDTATIRTPPFLPGKQQPDQESQVPSPPLLPGKQRHSGHLPPGRARPRSQTSSRASKTSHSRPSSRASKNLTQEPSSRASRNARSIFLPGKQELRPRISSRGSKNLVPRTSPPGQASTPRARRRRRHEMPLLPPPRPSPGLLALEESWVPPPHGKHAQGEQVR
jgi:hypothetical protein